MAAWGKRLGFALGVFGAAVGTGWVADGLAGVFGALSEWPTGTTNPMLQIAGWGRGICWTAETTGQALWLLIGMAVLLGSLLLLFRLRHGIIIAKAERCPDWSFHGHHTLIMGMSARTPPHKKNTANLRTAPFKEIALTTCETEGIIKSGDSSDASDEQKARTECLKGFQRHPWQQNLRMVWHHLKKTSAHAGANTLNRIYILPSSGPDPDSEDEFKRGSVAGANELREILKEKLAAEGHNSVEVRDVPPVDYENLDETAFALLELVRKARRARAKERPRRRSTKASGICVDVTVGQKPFSIAAALVTMNEDLIFGYVDNDGQAKFYDARVEVAASFGE
jgi:hypothetical protein